MGRRVAAVAVPARRTDETLEKADKRQRDARRGAARREAARFNRRRDAGDTPGERRHRFTRHSLELAGVAPGSIAALELLEVLRDAEGRRLLSATALSLLLHYYRDASAITDDGWEYVPPRLTQRERAVEVDLTDRQLRNLNSMLIAAGFLRRGDLVDCGDGVRTVFRRDGACYPVPCDRRVWELAPVVRQLFGDVANSPVIPRAGNTLPADLFMQQVVPSSDSFSEGTAVAVPVDLDDPSAWPPLELVTEARAERPTAAPRGGRVDPDSPSEPVHQVDDLDAAPVGGMLPPNPSPARQQTGGSPPPITPKDDFTVADAQSSATVSASSADRAGASVPVLNGPQDGRSAVRPRTVTLGAPSLSPVAPSAPCVMRHRSVVHLLLDITNAVVAGVVTAAQQARWNELIVADQAAIAETEFSAVGAGRVMKTCNPHDLANVQSCNSA